MNKMNPEIKEKWLAALRSGEYNQQRNYLKTDDGFCCLGVLCDLYSKDNNVDWEIPYTESTGRDLYSFLGHKETLPEQVLKWAGLNHYSPKVEDDNGNKVRLIQLNDTGSTFREIAGLIQKSL